MLPFTLRLRHSKQSTGCDAHQKGKINVISIGLLGAGRIGAPHGRNVEANQKARLAAIADVVAAPAESLGRELNAPVRSVDDILTNPAIQAVVICTSTDTHADLIEAAAKAGKAVFCEKPVVNRRGIGALAHFWCSHAETRHAAVSRSIRPR